MKMTAKSFSSSCAEVLIEKVTECSGTERLQGSLSLVKLPAVQLK